MARGATGAGSNERLPAGACAAQRRLHFPRPILRDLEAPAFVLGARVARGGLRNQKADADWKIAIPIDVAVDEDDIVLRSH